MADAKMSRCEECNINFSKYQVIFDLLVKQSKAPSPHISLLLLLRLLPFSFDAFIATSEKIIEILLIDLATQKT